MRLLVTGGAGFIGSHLVDELLAVGHDVAVLDNLSSGRREQVPAGARLYGIDLRDGDGVAKAVAEWCPEVVCHLAAQAAVRISIERPDCDAEVNILGGLRLVLACRQAGVRRLVYTSTGGAIYGEPERVPAPETATVVPLSPYGLSKHTFERYLDQVVAEGLKNVIIRPSNVYGPRQDPYGEAGVVAIFTQRMLRKEPVQIFGSGEQQRDFVYVGDVVQAFVRAVTSERTGAYNVGTSELTSVNELFAALAKLTGYERPPERTPAVPGEVFRISLDVTKAARELGWRPTVSLEEGLRRTVDVFRA